MRIVIPMSPPKCLTANNRNRNHWTKRHEADQEVAEVMKYEVMPTLDITEAIGAYDIDVEVVWGPEDYSPRSKLPDVENICVAIKPFVDQLQVHGVILDDALCRRFAIQQGRGDDGCIILDITPL